MPARMIRRSMVAALLTISAMAAQGCAGPAGRRFPPGSNSSTVAPDRATIPRGQTIPPAGLGVDLVRRPDPTAEPPPVRVALVSAHEHTALDP